MIHRLIKLELIFKQLDSDIAQDYQALHQRDRAIFDACPEAKRNNDWALIQHWLNTLHPNHTLIPAWLYGLAALIGFVSMLGLLSFSHGEWLNIFWLLFCFTVMPLVGSIILLWQLFHPSKTALSLFSPILRLIQKHSAIPLSPLSLSLVIQSCFLWFFTGAILGFLIKITFSDLVFVWQTSLAVTPNSVHQLFSLLALPFSWFMTLTPSESMVQSSQFLHLSNQKLAQDAQQWWPFILMLLLTWGVVPRLVILCLTMIKSQRYFKQQLTTGQIAHCLQRMKKPLIAVSTQAKKSSETSFIEPAFVNLPDIQGVLYWGQAKTHFNLNPAVPYLELGLNDWHSDEKALQTLVTHSKNMAPLNNIIICVLGHDSPLAELADLCELLPSDSQLFLMVKTDNSLQIKTWQRFIHRFLPHAQWVSYEP